MELINRIARLFRADLHSVLDRIEEPEALLRQAVREMEEAIGNDERRLALLQHEQTRLVKRSRDLKEAKQRLDDELDICFESSEEGLARNLIKRKLESQGLLKLLESKCAASSDELSALKHRLEENRAHLASVQQKLELVAQADSRCSAEHESGRACGKDYATQQISVSDDEVEVAFLSEKRRRQAS